MTEITQAIDELSNLKTLRQLEKESGRAKEYAQELLDRTNIQEQRFEQAKLRMEKIEEEEKDRCRKTAELLKEFESHCASGPFFESLLGILSNFQGKEDNKHK